MSAQSSPLFRGTAQLSALVERMQPLADFLATYRRDVRVLTLSRRDFETLRKYPEAAQALHQITTGRDGALYWRDFELRPAPAAPNAKKPLKP